MINILIYINDDLIDLYPNTTFQIQRNNFNLGDPSKRTSSFTSSIKIPPTESNRRIFNLYSSKTKSDKVLESLKIKVTQEGMQIFAGRCVVSGWNPDITINGITNESEIFKLLDGVMCNQIYETEDMGGGYLKPIYHKKLDSDEFYAQRNGLNNVYAPVMSQGKNGLVPDNYVENFDFVTTQAPWTVETLDNISSSINWTYASGGGGTMTAVMTAGNTSLAVVNRKTGVFAGFRYVITIDATFSTGSGTSTVNFFGLNENDIVFDFGTDVSPGLGSQTLSVEFTVDENMKAIGFYFTRVGPFTDTVVVDNVKLGNVEYVEVRSPFYVPSYSWVEALRIGVSMVFDGVFSYNSNFTSEQNDLIDSCVVSTVRGDLEYPQTFLEERNYIQEASGTQTISTTSTTTIRFPNYVQGSYGAWLSSGTWDDPLGATAGDLYYSVFTLQATDDPDSGYYADISLDVIINITTLTGAIPEAWVELSLNFGGGGNVFIRSNIFTTTGRKTISINTRQKVVDTTGALAVPYSYPKGVNMGTGVIVSARSRTTTATTTTYGVAIEYGRITVTPVPFPQDEAVLTGAFVLPDFSVLELLRDYTIRTCSLLRYIDETGTLEVSSLETIINRKDLALDWTSKRVGQFDDIGFTLDGYAQENYFMDDGGDNIPAAKMKIDVVNDNIEEKKTFFNSQFNAITDTPLFTMNTAKTGFFSNGSQKTYTQDVQFDSSGNILTVRDYDFSGIGEKSVLLKMRDSQSGDPEVRYGSNIAATFKVADYAKWTEFKDLFYNSFQESIEKIQVIERIYNLSVQDIVDADRVKLIYDDNEYFIVTSSKYQPGKLSKVSLFKVY